MANSTPKRAAKPTPPAAAPESKPMPDASPAAPAPASSAMSATRFSTWQVVGIVAAILALVAVACGAGLTIGYTAARVSRPALAISSMMPGFGTPQMPYGMPYGEMMPWGDEVPYGQMMPFYGQMHPPIGGAAYLGIGFEPGTDGALVTEVVDGGPAAGAGLKVGDVIQGVDGVALTRPNELRRLILAHQPGDEISLAIVRDGQEKEIVVVLGTAPTP